MDNHTIFQMFENPRRGRQARNFTRNVPNILDLKSSSEKRFFRNLMLTYGGVCRIIRHYQTYGTYFPLRRGERRNPSKLSDNVLESIELFKLIKPSMFEREIRERLLKDGMCDGRNLPALSTVNKE